MKKIIKKTKIEKKKIKKKVNRSDKIFVFLDSSAFLEEIKGTYCKDVMKDLKNLLDDDKIVLLVPEVIKIEIIKIFGIWQKQLTEKVESNLTIKKILGVEEEFTDNKSSGKGGKGKENKKGGKQEENALLIEGIIRKDRENIIKEIKDLYEKISADIKGIFEHNNARVILLNDQMMMSGLKRYLLKKAPYTKPDSDKREGIHNTDVDCIAFESLLDFFKLSGIQENSSLVICTKDRDYDSGDGKLHDDILADISHLKPKYYKSLPQMFYEEFKMEKWKTQLPKDIDRGKNLTLARENSGVDYSPSAVPQDLTSN